MRRIKTIKINYIRYYITVFSCIVIRHLRSGGCKMSSNLMQKS